MDIKFDATEHRYWIDGTEVPPVTSVLKPLQNFAGVPQSVLDNAAAFGTAVHKTIQLYEKGTLDTTSLDPALQKCLDQYLAAKAAKKFTVLDTEKIVGHRALKFAGTVDLFVLIDGHTCIVDIKTGARAPAVGPQTAGYALAYPLTTGYHGQIKRACLYLSQDAWKWQPLNDKSDGSMFLSCLNLYHWRAKHGFPT